MITSSRPFDEFSLLHGTLVVRRGEFVALTGYVAANRRKVPRTEKQRRAPGLSRRDGVALAVRGRSCRDLRGLEERFDARSSRPEVVRIPRFHQIRVLTDLYRWYDDVGRQLYPVYRDIESVPASSRLVIETWSDPFADVILGHDLPAGRAASLLRAVAVHLPRLLTWRSLVVDGGLSADEASGARRPVAHGGFR